MNHLSSEQLNLLLLGSLSEDDTLEAAEHLADCPECASALAELCEADPCESPPCLEEDIIIRLSEEKRLSWAREYHSYCFRVAAAVCASLVLIFSGGFSLNRPEKPPGEPSVLCQYISQAGSAIDGFFDRITNLEVPNNANQAK